jgi:predicted Zn-ribbon and HTH transcriptional regulator
MEQNGYQVTRLKCQRCGYEWVPRTERKPKTCPARKCHSPYWDTPYIHGPRQKKEGKDGD